MYRITPEVMLRATKRRSALIVAALPSPFMTDTLPRPAAKQRRQK